MPLFKNNNVDDESINQGQANINLAPEYLNKSIRGDFTAMVHDQQRLFYQMKVSPSLTGLKDLKGRLIEIADHWGVISDFSDSGLVVWGDFEALPENSGQYEILPDYSVK
jgi:hypothetical protein